MKVWNKSRCVNTADESIICSISWLRFPFPNYIDTILFYFFIQFYLPLCAIALVVELLLCVFLFCSFVFCTKIMLIIFSIITNN